MRLVHKIVWHPETWKKRRYFDYVWMFWRKKRKKVGHAEILHLMYQVLYHETFEIFWTKNQESISNTVIYTFKAKMKKKNLTEPYCTFHP